MGSVLEDKKIIAGAFDRKALEDEYVVVVRGPWAAGVDREAPDDTTV